MLRRTYADKTTNGYMIQVQAADAPIGSIHKAVDRPYRAADFVGCASEHQPDCLWRAVYA